MKPITQNRRIAQRCRAFSLVELSIVLVILGLLVGGVLSGQSLIKASQLRAVSSEFQRYSTAVYSFRDKYFALPGDMTNARKFWGDAGVGCTAGQAGQPFLPGTCDGNGDGIIFQSAVAGNWTGEAFRGWQHLALATLIEGQFTGLASVPNDNTYAYGKNAPSSRYPGASWILSNGNLASWVNTYFYQYDYRNAMEFGIIAGADSYADSPALTPTEAWNVDSKIDDGKPGIGKVVATNIYICTDSNSSTAYTTASYLLTSNNVACGLYFIHLK